MDIAFPPPPSLSRSLELILLDTLDAHQLGLKHKHTIRGDRSHGPGTITQLRRDGQPPLLTNTHVE
jgi:hypothetical protein